MAAGKRGRPKKPAELERLDGNPTKRPIIEPEVVGLGEPFVPPHLHEDAQACIEHIKRSMPPRVYSALDSYALAAFATAWAWHKHAAHVMSDPAFVPIDTDDRGVQRPSPWFRVLNSQSAEMRSWGDRLGLNPAARASLKLPGRDEPKSKFDGLVALTGSSRSLSA